MWTRWSDRREVQGHHRERRESSIEEEGQWSNTGETECSSTYWWMFRIRQRCSCPLSSFFTAHSNSLCLSAGEPAVETGAVEVSDQSGVSAQWDGLAEDGADRSKHLLWTVILLECDLGLFPYLRCMCVFMFAFCSRFSVLSRVSILFTRSFLFCVFGKAIVLWDNTSVYVHTHSLLPG